MNGKHALALATLGLTITLIAPQAFGQHLDLVYRLLIRWLCGHS